MPDKEQLKILKFKLEGELYFDHLMRKIYATDASVYRVLPLAVALPKNKTDIKTLIQFAKQYQTSLIPRAAGTSLAGQCVGTGIVVDISKYFTNIIDLDVARKTVTVQPGVVRDTLNNYLKPYGLWFSPNTSTSNRCTIGGMVGNNSSGTTSIKYGVTRDKVIAIETILSDGNEVTFGTLSEKVFHEKTKINTLEGHLYKTVYDILSPKSVQEEIRNNFPKPEIHRRNTGYAIDALLHTNVFSDTEELFNMSKILTGSEGTLAFTTAITLQLDDLPPANNAIVALHFNTLESCMSSVEQVMRFNLYTCEMMDDTILDLTKYNSAQQENRKFIEGNPEAMLLCELRADSEAVLDNYISEFIKNPIIQKYSYAAPVLKNDAIARAMELRKAGLGLLGNMVGDKKAVACIEDTAVALQDLASFITEFSTLMKTYNQKAVYYAHAGAGEIHLRPILNLKQAEDVKLFRKITTDVAHLVKKYKGSMSGEHGDGIVRAEFIPLLIGDVNYQLLKKLKTTFDPYNIFNSGKIVDAFLMDANLRYKPDRTEPVIPTVLDFSETEGILREAEKCNGSGDCRKLKEFGGTMCPSYRATRNEKDTTRARANALREFLTHSDKPNRFNHKEIKEVFDLCLSCKACATECPSSVDVAALKAEFLYQYQTANTFSLRSKLFAYNNRINRYAYRFRALSNFIFKNRFTSYIIKAMAGIAQKRSLPVLSPQSLEQFYKTFKPQLNKKQHPIKKVYLFNDEFTNFLDAEIGADAIELLTRLGYDVEIVSHEESGRALLSKGFLQQAKAIANTNVQIFSHLISEDTPLIGVEPSAILTFKDEYKRLADNKNAAKTIAKHTFLIEEFLQQEILSKHITQEQFTSEPKTIKFHGHCHQKALANQKSTFDILNLPENYKVTIIPSGCCGMAGSFGYEKAHYDVSMNIGNQTLFPTIHRTSRDVIIAANGTSCRHQIKDGTGKIAKHPVTILKEALVV